MSYRQHARLAKLEKHEQDCQAFPRLYVLWDTDKLPWDAPDNCLVVRLARKLSEEEWTRQALASLSHNQRLMSAQVGAPWPRPVEREAPPPHRQQP
jgi:hypothetical protein